MISIRIAALIVFLLGASKGFSKIPDNKNWKGEFDSAKGLQLATAEFNFKEKSGMLNLPDLIPVPLILTEVYQDKDSIFFTVGFRSGPAPCRGFFENDTLKGIMKKDGKDIATYWLTLDGEPEYLTVIKPGADEAVDIQTKNNSETELATSKRLKALLEKYDLEPYLYTKKIMIEDKTIPHSHPVLTISTRDSTDELLLSTFLHEQMHWYSLFKGDAAEKAISKFKKMYKDVPTALPEGGGSEFSTYLHILVNYLEYHCLKQLLGEEKAREVMTHWSTHHYTWIYELILNDTEKIEKVVSKYGVLDEL